METYVEMKARHQKEVNDFPLGFAFNNKQFGEMMENWGLDENDADQIYSIGFGGYVRRKDSESLHDLFNRQEAEKKAAIAGDKTGYGYIYQMFLEELNNHEYSYTCDLADTLNALGLSADEINADHRLLNGLVKAVNEIMNVGCQI